MSIAWARDRGSLIPWRKHPENLLPVTIIRFPTVVDIGSRYATDAMAEGSPELPNSLPQLLPQTNLSVPETVKDSVCGLDSPRSGCQGLFVTGRKGVPSNGVQNSNLQEQTDTAIACLGIASDNISSLSVKIK